MLSLNGRIYTYMYIYAEQNRTKQNVYVKQICLIK